MANKRLKCCQLFSKRTALQLLVASLMPSTMSNPGFFARPCFLVTGSRRPSFSPSGVDALQMWMSVTFAILHHYPLALARNYKVHTSDDFFHFLLDIAFRSIRSSSRFSSLTFSFTRPSAVGARIPRALPRGGHREKYSQLHPKPRCEHFLTPGQLRHAVRSI